MPTVSFLKSYYEKFPSIFQEYFLFHCQNTDERHQQSILKYQNSMCEMKKIYEKITHLIIEIIETYETKYKVTFPIEINLIVGGYGSNAYTEKKYIPNITFALERLPLKTEHLQVIIAHEFGHVLHNILSKKANIDWGNVDWNSPLTWLIQEGAATHFSRQIVRNLDESNYFSYDDQGQEWLAFARKYERDIIRVFNEDIQFLPSTEIFKEWFSINGGEQFGHARLGYYIGNLVFQDQVQQKGELNTVLLWKNPNYKDEITKWLFEF